MKKLALIFILAFSSAAALSSEVGAQTQLANSAKFEVAIAETGTSTSWALQLSERKATAHQLAEHMNRIAVIDSVMNTQLEAAIERKLATSLKF